MTANKQVSRDAVVHGCFSEGGDFILNIFYWESKLASLINKVT